MKLRPYLPLGMGWMIGLAVFTAAATIMNPRPALQPWIMKLDLSLQTVWEHTLRKDPDYTNGYGAAVRSGNLIGMFEVRTSAEGGRTRFVATGLSGRKRFQHEYPGRIANHICEATGGWILAGNFGDSTNQASPHGVWAMRIGYEGDSLWSFGADLGTRRLHVQAVAPSPDGGALIVVEKLNAEPYQSKLALYWSDAHGKAVRVLNRDSVAGDESVSGCVALPGQGWVLNGRTWTTGADSTAWLMGISADGHIVWRKTYPRYFDSGFMAMTLLADGNLLFTAPLRENKQSLLAVLKTYPNGEEIWSRELRLKAIMQSPFVAAAAELGDQRILLASGDIFSPRCGMFELSGGGDSLSYRETHGLCRGLVPTDDQSVLCIGGIASRE